ncbi:MAG: hypothetical protein FWC36_06345 [Spirochaetes bacterium]|nr:hypothetical protein [Spirochaetota bacterium]
MKKQIFSVIYAILSILLLTACFSPWDGFEDDILLSITPGGGDGNVQGFANEHELRYEVTFIAADGSQITFISEGSSIIRGTIAPGEYTVSVRVYLMSYDTVVYAEGVGSAVITVGGNNVIQVSLNYVFPTGTGTLENPFRVVDVETLERVGKGVGAWEGNWSLSAHYSLVRDIDLAGSPNWVPIPSFSGTFDGNARTIRNITIHANTHNQGFFSTINATGVVRNLNLEAVNINVAGNWVGGIAGQSSGRIENISARGEITGNNHIGGITGQNNTSGVISNSYFAGTLTGALHINGIAGTNNGTIEDSFSSTHP